MDATTSYTETEAVDLAVMLLVRKLRRTAGPLLDQVLGMMPEGAREALAHAEQRGDAVKDAEEAAGLPRMGRPWPSRFDGLGDDLDCG